SFKNYVAIFLIAGIAGFGGAGVFKLNEKKDGAVHYVGANPNVHFTDFKGGSPEAMGDFVQAADVSVPAVVHVKTEYAAKNYVNPFQYNDPWGGLFGNPNMKSQPGEGSGSGVII